MDLRICELCNSYQRSNPFVRVRVRALDFFWDFCQFIWPQGILALKSRARHLGMH